MELHWPYNAVVVLSALFGLAVILATLGERK